MLNIICLPSLFLSLLFAEKPLPVVKISQFLEIRNSCEFKSSEGLVVFVVDDFVFAAAKLRSMISRIVIDIFPVVIV